jgi:hypothetical protein
MPRIAAPNAALTTSAAVRIPCRSTRRPIHGMANAASIEVAE